MASSVVIPTKNRSGLVGRAVESALRQTLPVREVVVVDDGSDDDTPEIVLEMAQHDDRVRLVRLDKSIGAAAARNRGVAETVSDWVCFLDSDDAWEPEKHERQVEAIAGAPRAVASFTGLRYASMDGEFDVPAPISVSHLDLRGNNVVGSTSSAMIRRKTFDAVGGFDPTLPSCQDWDLWMKLHEQGDFAMVSDPLVTFTQDSNGRISKNKDAVFRGHGIVFSRALQGLSDHRQRRRVMARHQYRLAQILLHDMDEPIGAARAAIHSIALRPTRMGAWMLYDAAKRALGGARA